VRQGRLGDESLRRRLGHPGLTITPRTHRRSLAGTPPPWG
jgi:hypothetical protein